MDILLRLFICLLVIFFIISINQLLQEITKQKSKKISTRSHLSNYNNHNRSEVAQLKKQLLGMVGGNNKTVGRLIKQLRLKHPQERETWYFEKAIYDLERDRNFK